MELKIEITQESIDLNTENSMSSRDIVVDGHSLSAACAPHYSGILQKIPSIVRSPENIDVKKTVNSKGEVVEWVTVFANSNTSELFSMFKSIGLYFPKLAVGICRASNTLYTSSKLCKDLSRFSDTQKSAMLMYILSIVEFVIRSNTYLIKYEMDGLSGALKVTGKGNFEKCIRTFSATETWYLKDSHDDSYSSVHFQNTGIAKVADTFRVTGMRLGILKSKSGGYAGTASIKFGTAQYTFIVTEKATFTDFDLCAMEISADSVCSCIASAFPDNMTLRKVDTLPLSATMQFVEFDTDGFEEFAKSTGIPKPIVTWITNMAAKGATVADLDDIMYLCTTYKVEKPEGATIATSLTREEMQKTYEHDAYAQELYHQIQPYYETYKLGAALDANVKGFSNGAIYSMVFVGESGTGKSTAARVLPTRAGIPYVSVNLSVNVEEADLFGSMVPNAEKAKPEDPEFVWADGIITKAVRNGYCVVLEEFNFARPGVLGKLNSLLDENRQIDLATGEIVRAHPNFRIIATCNIAYEGTNRFNKALINRFDDVTVFEDLSRGDAIAVIKQRTGYSNATKISKVFDVYEALKKFSTEQNVSAVVSMRQLLNIFTKGKYYSSAKDAVQRIMINGAFIEDSEYQKVFESTVLPAFDLKFKL